MSKDNPRLFELKPSWRDQDALGHVNNAVYLSYIENAREAYWREFAGDFDIFPFMLARIEIDYLAPATWRDQLVIKTWISRLGNSSFDFSHRLEVCEGSELARVKSVQVMFDHARSVKTMIDDDLRARFEAFESG